MSVTTMQTESPSWMSSESGLEFIGFKSEFFTNSETFPKEETGLLLATVTLNPEGMSNEISSLP